MINLTFSDEQNILELIQGQIDKENNIETFF